MKQWNGLLKKEWVTMRGQLYTTVSALLLFTLLFPFGSSFFSWGFEGVYALEASLFISGIWLGASMVIPAIMLLISLRREMGRLDVWLHSPASIFKLFGSKALFAGFIGAVNMAIAVIIIVVESRIMGYILVLTPQTIVVLLLVFTLMSLLILCLGLFFGVLHQLIKPVAKGFAVPIVALLFLSSSWLFERISATPAYKKIGSIGPLPGPKEKVFDAVNNIFFMELNAITFHMGDIFINLLFAVLLFAMAVVLFEKKVRI